LWGERCVEGWILAIVLMDRGCLTVNKYSGHEKENGYGVGGVGYGATNRQQLYVYTSYYGYGKSCGVKGWNFYGNEHSGFLGKTRL